MPTLCDILNLECPKDRPIDGISIAPLLNNKEQSRNKTIKWMYNVADNFDSTYTAAISGDRYKLYATYNKGKMTSSELYDLIDDPSESHDLSKENHQELKSLQSDLDEWRQSVITSATKTVNCMNQ